MRTIHTIASERITLNVYEAIEDHMFLPVGEKCSLEYLSKNDDAIFPTPASWRQFIIGNFSSNYSKDQWREEIKESTLKRWTWPTEKYIHKFAVKIGKDKYLAVDKEEIELVFDYDVYFSRSKTSPEGFIVTAVEFFVTANIKGK